MIKWGLFLSLVFAITGFSENIAVSFSKYSKTTAESPPWNFEKYGIKHIQFEKSNLEGFKEALSQAKIFVICRNTGEDVAIIFKKPSYRKAISNFLKKGGILIFQYSCGLWVSDVKKYLKETGVEPPGKAEGEYYKISISEENKNHPLLTSPNKLPAVSKLPSAYGWWKSWSEKQKPLFVSAENQKNAAMLIQENVLGNGKVIFSRIFYLTGEKYLKREKLYNEFIENLFTYAFGPLKKGEVIELNKKGHREKKEKKEPLSKKKFKKANTLYFRNLIKKPWWNEEWNYRVPVLVAETIGLERYKVPVSIIYDFPQEIKISSIRVVTPWGEEIPSQVKFIDKNKNEIEIFFLVDLLPYEHLPFFIYFDNENKPFPQYSSDLKLTEDNEYFILSNSNLFCKIRKDKPYLVHIQSQGNPTGNQFHDEVGFSPEGYGMRIYKFNGYFSKGKVVENGPLRKTIEYSGEYKGKNIFFRFFLISESKKINYSIYSNSRTTIQRRIGWLPGKGLNPSFPDMLYFPGKENVRYLKIKSCGELVKNLIPEMGEGWYAFEDTETGQVVGELFDLKDITGINVYIHGYRGFSPTISEILFPSVKGALLSLNNNSGFSDIRNEYLSFKNPPEIYISKIQKKKEVSSSWKIPIFGKNLIRSYHQFYGWYLGKETYPEKPYLVIPYFIHSLKKMGANWITLWAYRPFWKSKFAKGPRTQFLSHLIKEAHKSGMGIEIGTPHLDRARYWGDKLPEGWNADFVKFKDYFIEAARELGNYDIDIYLLMDEDCYVMKSEEAKELFKKIYKMEPPNKIELKKLNLPPYYNKVLFQMNIYTETLKSMAEAVREKNKKVFLGDQVNVSSMTNIERGGPHDWEKHSDFLTTLSMDLYGKPRDTYKYYIKLMRATFNGKNPILVYCGCTPIKEYVKLNQNYLLMWGIDGLVHFSPGYCYKEVFEEVKKNFYFLDYTGLGDKLAEYEPVKYIGILRDRNAFLDSLRNGMWSSRGGLYDVKIQNITLIKNFQTDIIFSKYFNLNTLKNYPILIVVDNPVLSDNYAKIIENYVKKGGNVIIEGRGINNKIIQKLVRVLPTGKIKKKQGKINGSISYDGNEISVENKGAEIIVRFDDGEPVFFVNIVGNGKIFYTPLILSEKVLYQEKIADLIKQITGKIIAPPVKILDNSVDSNLLTDGENYIFSIYNPTYEDKKVEAEFYIKNNPEVIVDFATGKVKDFKKKLTLFVPRNEIRFFYIGRKKNIELPEIKKLDLKTSPFYSKQPGENLLSFILKKEEEENAKFEKRKKEKDVSYVGILTDKGQEDKNYKARIRGDEGIYQVLKDKKKLKVEYINNLKPETLSFYDVIIIPNIGWAKLPPVMEKGWEQNIRNYVFNGGSCLLCHHAIGFNPCEYPPFPEIGEPAGNYVVNEKSIVIKISHPITTGESLRKRFPKLSKDPAFEAQLEETHFKVGEIFESSYPDYIPIKPGKDGKVICTGKNGEPVIVAGKVGKGKVILCGISLGAKSNDKEGMSKGEENILINSVYWLTEK